MAVVTSPNLTGAVLSWEGTIESGGLLPTLRCISGLELGGLLAVQGEHDLVSITFRRGRVVAADAMNRSAEEALSEVLANNGLLSPAEFSRVVESELATGQLASEVILAKGLVPKEQLLDAVRQQIYRQTAQLLRWSSGDLQWTNGAESPSQEGVEPLSIGELLLRATDEFGSEGPLGGPAPELTGVFQTSGKVVREPKLLGEDGIHHEGGGDDIWLTPIEHRLLELTDGRQTAAELAAAIDCDPPEARYALQHLVEAELLEPTLKLGELDSVGLDSPSIGSPGSISADGVSEPSQLDLDEGVLTGASDNAAHGGEPGYAPSLLDDPLESVAPSRSVSRRPDSVINVATMWTVRALGIGLVALLLMQLSLRSERNGLLFPFPWQDGHRDRLERAQWLSTVERIDRALRVYHLLYGRFPDDLEILVDLELLDKADLYDARGRWLSFSPEETRYVLHPVEGEVAIREWQVEGGIDDDFLLNPRYVDLESLANSRPVQLLN